MIAISKMDDVWRWFPSSDEIHDLARNGVHWVKDRPRVMYAGIGVLTVVVFCELFGTTLRHKFMAWFLGILTKKENPAYEAYKRKCFEALATTKSADKELAAQGVIRILEVGVGTGTNFKFYPNNTHLIVVDPNPYFTDYYNKNRAKFPNIKSEEIIVCKGEEMNMIPSESTDVVVMTLVLCSVDNVTKILQQVYRILVPGGKFYFIEHTSEFKPKEYPFRAFFQQFFTYAGIWPFLFDGCSLIRDHIPILKKVGFVNADFHRYYAPWSYKFLYLVEPHVYGNAAKPEKP